MYENWETYNPLAGRCEHDCLYCSTDSFRNRFSKINEKYNGVPRIDEKAMTKNLGKNKNIFICAQNDLFAQNVPENIIKEIMQYCGKYPENTYLFQTKNPKNIRRIMPENSIVCVTIESNRWYPEFMGNTPRPIDRIIECQKIRHELHITCEPLMAYDLISFVDLLKSTSPTQINLGANSNKSIKLPEPSKDEVLALILELEKFTKVVIKKNLSRLIK